MPKHEYTIQEAIRMVGHLLEHHPTTGAAARDSEGVQTGGAHEKNASRWCIVGAASVVARYLTSEDAYYDKYQEICLGINKVLALPNIIKVIDAWEGSVSGVAGVTPATRLTIARKLQQA